MNCVRHGDSTTFETKSSYRRVARQGLPGYTAVARFGFKRRASAVLKSNLIRSIDSIRIPRQSWDEYVLIMNARLMRGTSRQEDKQI